MSSPPKLRVLERSQVSPPPGTVAESNLPLTIFDVLWLHGGAVERVFFYHLPCSTSHFCASVLPALKSSLSLALHQFYPLAGKLRRLPDTCETRYADGDSVSFTVAECDADFDEVSRSHARDVNLLLPLLPQLGQPEEDDGGDPVLAVQVTVFPDQGVAIAVAVHHAECDGSSSTRFMSSWASTCAQSLSSSKVSAAAVVASPPVFDRSLISDPNDLFSIFYRIMAAPSAKLSDFMSHDVPPDAVIASFTLKRDHIQRLKEMVSSKAKATAGGASFHCSTIVVTFAYVWVCLVKARAYESDRVAPLMFAADCRERLQPPVPAAYFGNCISGCIVKAKGGELTGEDGVAAAARAIGKAIEEFKSRPPLQGWEKWSENFGEIAAQRPLSVAGSPKFRVYDLDFGWGRPKKVEITSIVRTGAMSVAESREEEGGVEIGLVLPKEEMAKFETQFSNGILSS